MPSLLPLDPHVWRPAPLDPEQVAGALRVTRATPPADVAQVVIDGGSALFVDQYANLAPVRAAINAALRDTGSRPDSAGASREEVALQRERRAEKRAAGRRLLVPVRPDVCKMALEGSPEVGYFGTFYGPSASAGAAAGGADDDGEVVLRANDAAALHVAWQFFLNGVQYPFLRHKLHPFYGVYFTPTPVEHFRLLIDWLEEHPEALAGPSARALELGTGCGVIPFILREYRPHLKVVASDVCPNAVFSVRNEIARWNVDGIDVVQSDLFEGLRCRGRFNAIIFNPPWVPRTIADWQPSGSVDGKQAAAGDTGDVTGGNDYPPDLFARLFAGAAQLLRPGGRLLILFSDYAECRGLVDRSPLLDFATGDTAPQLELRGVRRRPVEASLRSSHRQTQRDKSWVLGKEHSVELWEFVRVLK